MTPFLAVLVLATISGGTTLLGIWLAFWSRRSDAWITFGLAFAAGIMAILSVSELFLVSWRKGSIFNITLATLTGLGVMWLFDKILPALRHRRTRDHSKQKRTAMLVALSIILHDFPEGFGMAQAFLSSPMSGLLVAAAIALHNIPEEFALAVPLVNLEKKGFLFQVAILSGLAEPLGAMVGLLAVSLLPTLHPLFMAFAAGAMVYVAVVDLAPLGWSYHKPFPFTFGIGLSLVTYLLLSLIVS